MKKYLKIFGLLLICSSCEEMFYKPIDYAVPYDEPKLTMDTRITAGDSIIVMAGVSAGVMDKNNQPILDNNSTVNLYENNILVSNLKPLNSNSGYYYEGGYYSTSFIPTEGKTYKVEVVRNGYTTSFGEDYMISKPNVSILNTDSIGGSFVVNLQITDNGNVEDFYMLTVTPDSSQNYYNYRYTFQSYDPNIEFFYAFPDPFEGDNNLIGDIGHLTDKRFNGEKKQIKIAILGWNPQSGEKLNLNVYHISKDYYLHEKSKAATYWTDDSGLFSEPVQIYTNITNGYGVVACASKTVLPLN